MASRWMALVLFVAFVGASSTPARHLAASQGEARDDLRVWSEFVSLQKNGLVEAKTWVPFYEPERAFIVYLCWEQSRLQGNQVTLERLAGNEAVVSMDSIFLRLYTQTSHMRRLIQQPDYV